MARRAADFLAGSITEGILLPISYLALFLTVFSVLAVGLIPGIPYRAILASVGRISSVGEADWTFTVPPASGRGQTGEPCPYGTGSGNDFRLDQGQSAYVTCTYSAPGSGFGPWPTLDYGQRRSLGAITCASEPSGISCTDSGTGHFFRLAQQSYELG